MHHGVTFNFDPAKMCSPAIFDTSFAYAKDIWTAATDYYTQFYIIVLFYCATIAYHVGLNANSGGRRTLANDQEKWTFGTG